MTLPHPAIIDPDCRRSAVEWLRRQEILLPTLSQLAEPHLMPPNVLTALSSADPDAPDPVNLWRLHWFNDTRRSERADLPGFVFLPSEITGVKCPIVVLLGCRFPMIAAHKVLAAYACLAPRLVAGQFDPARHRAVWPSTGNYCRGGIAISRILGCRGVAVLPAGMSRERFEWLQRWVEQAADIIRTPGTESNVKEIYDRCRELARDPDNVIFNQFAEFANYLIHYHCTGRALARVFSHLKGRHQEYRLAAFVAATGSAGTLGAGDFVKAKHGTKIVAAEALECPTMLWNGYGEHNIQGIGDKHIPLIHNVMNTDVVIGVSDAASDGLNLLFGSEVGREYLIRRRRMDPELVRRFGDIGLSGLANIVAAIKLAKYFEYASDDIVMTVATDSAALYESERAAYSAKQYPRGLDEVSAGELFARFVEAAADDHVVELRYTDRKRIFNLGYYTWVEQQGVSLGDFDRRKEQSFWRELVASIDAWDRLIHEFNAEIRAASVFGAPTGG